MNDLFIYRSLRIIFLLTSLFTQMIFAQTGKSYFKLNTDKQLFPENNSWAIYPELSSLPKKEWHYTWQSNGEWKLNTFTTNSYNENGQIDTAISYTSEGGDPVSKIMYLYDTLYRLIKRTHQNYNNGFVNDQDYRYSFDEHGNQTDDLLYEWSTISDQWFLAWGNKYTYTYNGAGTVTEKIQKTYSLGWDDSYKYVYLFDGQESPLEIIRMIGNNGQWYNLSRNYDISWKSYNPVRGEGEYIYYLEDQDAGNGWETAYRFNYTYYSNGSYVSIRELYKGSNIWENLLKIESIMNEEGRLEEFSSSEWQQGQWIETMGIKVYYTFDGIDLIELIVQDWHAESAQYVNSDRYLFSGFLHFESIQESEAEQSMLRVFPNPFNNIVNVEIAGMEANALIITNLQGGMVLLEVIPKGTSLMSLDFQGIPAGLYFIRIMKEGHCVGKAKVVKK